MRRYTCVSVHLVDKGYKNGSKKKFALSGIKISSWTNHTLKKNFRWSSHHSISDRPLQPKKKILTFVLRSLVSVMHVRVCCMRTVFRNTELGIFELAAGLWSSLKLQQAAIIRQQGFPYCTVTYTWRDYLRTITGRNICSWARLQAVSLRAEFLLLKNCDYLQCGLTISFLEVECLFHQLFHSLLRRMETMVPLRYKQNRYLTANQCLVPTNPPPNRRWIDKLAVVHSHTDTSRGGFS